MRRLLLFLVLAGGGLAALGALGGGFAGSHSKANAPDVPEVAPRPSAGPSEPVSLSELPISDAKGAGRGAPLRVEPAKAVDRTFDEPVVWTDPASGERVEIPNAPTAWVTFREPATMRDPTGAPGARWSGARIVLYREPKTWTRAEVDAVVANPKQGRRGLERFVITAEEGWQTTTALVAPGERAPRERTTIRLTNDVEIRDVVQGIVVTTSDVIVDREAGTAEGPAPIVATAPGWVAKGRGFRLDRSAERLEILEGSEVDARDLVMDGRPAADATSGNTLRPRIVRAKGSTIVTSHSGEPEPSTEVRMDGGVHVELDGGGRLDAASVRLRIVERPGADGGRPEPATAKGASDPLGKRRLERMIAEGDVRFEGRDERGALLTAAGPKLTAEFPIQRMRTMLLSGKSVVTWRGELGFPGEGPLDRIVRAAATESLLFGPSDTSAEGAVLDLVGGARVECGRAPADPVPQRIAADRITLHLRRKAGTVPLARDGRRGGAGFDWVATTFAATGGVVLDGPRLSGAAREMRGFDLEQDTYRFTATGEDAHLAIADDTTSAPRPGSNAAPKAPAAAPGTRPATPPKTWVLERLVAKEDARGSLHTGDGDGTATFSGASLTVLRATGAEIRELPGRVARVTLGGREGRDRSVEAPTIRVSPGAAERVLSTEGRTVATVWLDDEGGPADSVPPKEGRVVELRSGARIEVTGGRAPAGGDERISVALAEGGTLSARSGSRVTDRLSARTIDLTLVESVARPSDTAFALPGSSPPSKSASSRRADPPRAKSTRKPSRFVVECDRLELAVGDDTTTGGVRRVVAQGRVDARGDDPEAGARRFEGDRFEYDGATAVGVLLGTSKRARITLGDEPAIQRLLSPRIEVTFRDGVLSKAVFAPPVAGLVHTRRTDRGRPTGELERFVLADESGPLVVEGTTIVLEGTVAQPVRVAQSVRDAQGRDVGDPLTIVTPRLTLTTTSPFGTPGSTLARLEADGAGTYLVSGADPKTASRIVGDRIRYERAAAAGANGTAPRESGILRVTSTTGTVLLAKPGSTVEAFEVTVDLATRMVNARLKSARLVSPPR